MLVGTLDGRMLAHVDGNGRIAVENAGFELDWWIGAEDRWHVPEHEVAVRQSLVDDAPVVRTRMRVPGGDAGHTVYAIAGATPALVIDLENASPAPFVAALVVRHAAHLTASGAEVRIDGRFVLRTPRAASRWACEHGSTLVRVTSGRAHDGAFPGARDRGARLEGAFLHPVPHRTRLRAVLTGPGAAPSEPGSAANGRADAAGVARGWRRYLDHAMTVSLPDARLVADVRAALGQAILGACRRNPPATMVAALEDWGFDTEAERAWGRLSRAARRAASQRAAEPASWTEVRRARPRSAELLVALRSLLVHEGADGLVVCAEVPPSWRGAPVDVHDAPVRAGRVSYAVRWHGARPVLLWEVPGGVTLRAPGLDRAWATTAPRGEALLTPVPSDGRAAGHPGQGSGVEAQGGDLPGS